MPPLPLETAARSLHPCRVETATGRTDPSIVGRVGVTSGDAWRGLRLDEVTLPPADQREGYLRYHALMVHTGRPVDVEAAWSDGTPRMHRLVPGAMTLFPAWEPYRMRWDVPLEYHMVRLAPETVASVTEGSGIGTLCPQVAVEDKLVAHLVAALHGEARTHALDGTLYAETLGTALVAHLVHAYGRSGPAQPRFRGGLPLQSLRRVQEYIEANLAGGLHLPELARIAGVSVRHFVRAFKESTRLTPHQFVLVRRIERAARLLADRDLTVADIAMQCGFGSQSRFAAAFRRLKDITPAAYRKAIAP